MEQVLNEIFRAIHYLLITGVIYFIYKIAFQYTDKSNFKKVLLNFFCGCVVIALFSSLTLGDPSCLEKEYSDRGSYCVEYSNDGFKPTNTERIAEFSYYFVVLFIPTLIGIYQGKRKLID